MYQLSSVYRNFIDTGRELNHGDEAKSKLIGILAKHVSQFKVPSSKCPHVDIVAIDGMQVVQKMSNPAWVKIFKDLVGMFCQDLEELFGSCRVEVIAFDTYYDISIKSSTQSGRLGNAVLVEFTVDDAFDINDASLKEILSHTSSKQQPSSFFAKKLQTYLEQKNIDFVIAGNWLTVMPWSKQSSNNHKEADSRIAHIMKLALDQVLCTDMLLYTLSSNLFFKIEKWFSLKGQICFLTIKHFR